MEPSRTAAAAILRHEARIHAAPRSTLMDEVVSVRVSDLQPRQRVTLVTRLQEAGNRFLGHAWYTADDRGTVDVQTAESTGGSYKGMTDSR